MKSNHFFTGFPMDKIAFGMYCSSIWLMVTVLIAGCSASSQDPLTLFERRAANKTGVHFVNEVRYQPQFNILDYLYFYDGGGVAIGDINNDGLQDLYFTANMGANKLYLNQGDFQFRDITSRAGVAGSSKAWSTGVTTADVNGDGWLDIYVCQVNYRTKKGHNLLYINNGDATFTEKSAKYGLDFKGLSTQAAFLDYDRDGDLDMYLLNHSVHSNRSYGSATKRKNADPEAGDRLYRNDGTHFTDVTHQSNIYSSSLGYGLGLAISDINKDGWPDIYIGNDFHENDYLYLNNRDGTFDERLQQMTGHTSQASMGNDIADVNNDARPDIFSLDMRPEDRATFQQSGADDTEQVTRIKKDLGYAPQISRNTLQLNRGSHQKGYPLFSEIGAYAGIESTDWSWAGLLADLNNDGWKDLYVTNGIVRRPNDLDYIQYVSQPRIQKKLQNSSADFEQKVIRQMPSKKIPNYAFRNNGNLTFSSRSKAWGLAQPSFSNGAAYGDLDNDGDLDLAVNNINMRAFLYQNQSDSLLKRHYLQIKLKGEGRNTTGVGAKVIVNAGGNTYYREQTTTRGFQSSVPHMLHFGLGENIKRVDSLTVIWPDGRYQILRNVAVDQRLTVNQQKASGIYHYEDERASDPVFQQVTADYDIPYTHQENIYSDFKRQPLIPHKLSTQGPPLAAGDVNGDGLEDFYAGGARGQAGKLYLQISGGLFRAGDNQIFRKDWARENVDATFADVDGDGDQDLYVVNGGGGEFSVHDRELQDRLFLNRGNGTFTIAQNKLPGMYGNGACVAPADYDDDGDIDFYVGNRSVPGQYGASPRSYLLQNDGHGNFTEVTQKIAPGLAKAGMVSDAVWSDVTGGDAPDLVLVGEWMPVTVWQNSGTELHNVSRELKLENTNGWWESILVTDFNGDGKKDIVAGNQGTNSLLHATESHPLKLFVSDFDYNGVSDPIIAQFHSGAYYPRARRDELLRQLPAFQSKIPTYKAYSRLSIKELFGEKELQQATVYKAYTFETSYFRNNGPKGFVKAPLPEEVQWMPVYALASGDFNSDGQPDLLMKGNNFAADTDQGRYDAGYGLLLTGNKRGKLTAMPMEQSGFILKGAGRDIEQIDTGSNTLILIALHNSPLEIFRFSKK